jgi:DNA repair photolyase
MLYKPKQVYFSAPDPKQDVVEQVRKEAPNWAKLTNPPEIMLCFIGDPYQPAEMDLGLTRSIIKIFIEHNLPFSILTKGGSRAKRDFDLLEKYPHCRFGTSLSLFDNQDAAMFEPGAADVIDRVDTIATAAALGIKTWVSLEPIIIPDQAVRLVNMIYPLVDHWAVGKINHNKTLEAAVDWPKCLHDIEAALNNAAASYFIKTSLEKYRHAN